jgi:hypothetical protein
MFRGFGSFQSSAFSTPFEGFELPTEFGTHPEGFVIPEGFEIPTEFGTHPEGFVIPEGFELPTEFGTHPEGFDGIQASFFNDMFGF